MSNRKKHEEIHDQQELCDCCATWAFDVCHYSEAKNGEDLGQDDNRVFTKDMLTDRKLVICESCVEDAANDLDMEFCDDVLPPDTFHKLWEWVKLEAVLNFIGFEDEPKNIEDVEEFFDALCGLMSWHPDDSFDQYVYNADYKPTMTADERRIFSDQQAEALDKIMAKCFEICDKAGKEIYELGMAAMRKAGQAPPLPETPAPTAASESPKQLVEHTDAQIEQLYALVDDAARLLADDVNEDCAAWHAKLTDVLAPDFRYRPAQKREEEDSKVMIAISALARIKHFHNGSTFSNHELRGVHEIASEALDKIIPDTKTPLHTKYTVLLMYPDYACDSEGYGQSWLDTVEAQNVDEAIKLAQAECAKGCTSIENPEDLKPVCVFEGDHQDVINEWSEIRK